MAEGHKNLGWELLANSNVEIEIDNSLLRLIGIHHLAYCSTIPNKGDVDTALQNRLYVYDGQNQKTNSAIKSKPFDILLAHDPDIWPYVYQKYKFPIMFSGHTHGSQKTGEFDTRKLTHLFRLVKGSITPPSMSNNYEPKKTKSGFINHRYYGGTYKHDGCYLLVDKGCGFSGASTLNFDFIVKGRNGVRPEVSIITLRKK